jgi:thioesterase domain-containing protein/acyl carrier protein
MQYHRTFFFVNEFPLKTTGKVDVEKLIEENLQRIQKSELIVIEEDPLKKVWQRILNIESISDETHFFESGGDSLNAIVLMFEIEKLLNIKLAENYLFNYPTFKDFKKNIDSNFQDSFLIELKAGKKECPIYFIPYFRGNGWSYNTIANLLDTDQAVYSFNKFVPQDLNLVENIITYLVKVYVDEILKTHSVSKIILAGSSLGGNVAIEMSKLLEKESIHVEQIHLLDSVEASFYRDKHVVFSTGFIIDKLRSLKREIIIEVATVTLKLCNKLNSSKPKLFSLISKFIKFKLDDKTLHRLKFQRNELKDFKYVKKHLQKLGKYAVNLNPGIQIIFYQADESKDFKFEDCMGWKNAVKNLKSFKIRGGHVSILEKPYVYDLAKVMNYEL